jgi:hypothetical protein
MSLLTSNRFKDFRTIGKSKQTSLSIDQRDVTSSARLIHFDLSLPALAQWTASSHIAELRADAQLFASLSKETCEEENYNDLVQVFTQGSPTLVLSSARFSSVGSFLHYAGTSAAVAS